MVAVYVGHRQTTFLTLVKQIGKKYSHLWDSGEESIDAETVSKPLTRSDLSLMVLFIVMVTLA